MEFGYNPPVKLPKIGNLPAPFTQGGLWPVRLTCYSKQSFTSKSPSLWRNTAADLAVMSHLGKTAVSYFMKFQLRKQENFVEFPKNRGFFQNYIFLWKNRKNVI